MIYKPSLPAKLVTPSRSWPVFFMVKDLWLHLGSITGSSLNFFRNDFVVQSDQLTGYITVTFEMSVSHLWPSALFAFWHWCPPCHKGHTWWASSRALWWKFCVSYHPQAFGIAEHRVCFLQHQLKKTFEWLSFKFFWCTYLDKHDHPQKVIVSWLFPC